MLISVYCMFIQMAVSIEKDSILFFHKVSDLIGEEDKRLPGGIDRTEKERHS